MRMYSGFSFKIDKVTVVSDSFRVSKVGKVDQKILEIPSRNGIFPVFHAMEFSERTYSEQSTELRCEEMREEPGQIKSQRSGT